MEKFLHAVDLFLYSLVQRSDSMIGFSLLILANIPSKLFWNFTGTWSLDVILLSVKWITENNLSQNSPEIPHAWDSIDRKKRFHFGSCYSAVNHQQWAHLKNSSRATPGCGNHFTWDVGRYIISALPNFLLPYACIFRCQLLICIFFGRFRFLDKQWNTEPRCKASAPVSASYTSSYSARPRPTRFMRA